MKSIKSTTTKTMPLHKGAWRLLALLVALMLLPPMAIAGESAVPTSMRVAIVVPKDMELYPLKVMSRDAASVFDLVYDSLVVLNDDMRPEPSLAASWECLPGGKTWKFTLRDNVYFHNGKKLTAYDVLATMNAIVATAGASEAANEKGLYALLTNTITHWEADDERTLRVTTEKPYYALLYAMTFPVFQAQSAFEANPPGTGPYRVDYYAPGETLWLRGNENWWGGLPPHVSQLRFDIYESESLALAAFEAEQVDIMMTRSTDAVRYRGTVSSRSNAYAYATRQLECLLMNNSANYLGKNKERDVVMRKAIAYAVNTAYLKANVYQGLVLESGGTLQRPGSWLYNEAVESAYPYRPEEARALLDSLGYNQFNDKGYRIRQTDAGPEELVFRLGYYDEAGNSTRKEAASQIAAMLEEVGIHIRINQYTYEEGANKLKVGDYDLFLCAFTFDTVPDPSFLLASVNTNYARYNSKDMAAILQELRKCTEAADFAFQWHEIQRQMAEDMPFYPLYWREGIMLTRYPFSAVRDIREYELLRSIERYR